MRNLRLFGIAGLAVLAAACQYIPESLRPEVRGVRPQIRSLDLQGVGMNFNIDVHNPLMVDLRAPRFQYNLAVEGANFRSGEEALEVNLPAGKTGALSVPVHIGYYELWSLVSGLRSANQAQYQLDGAFLLDAAGQDIKLPVAHKGSFPIFQMPRFTITGLDASGLSLSGGRVAVSADAVNPNAFDIGVRALGYALKLGDSPLANLGLNMAQDIPAGGTGRLELTGTVSALDAARQLLEGNWRGRAQLVPSGSVQTPYGPVKLPEF